MQPMTFTPQVSRRRLLQRLSQAAILVPLAGSRLAQAAAPVTADPVGNRLRFAATDGHFALPGRMPTDPLDYVARTGPVFGMGFVEANLGATINQVIGQHRGKVQWTAPILIVAEANQLEVILTNAGLKVRPDLDDSHTIHWHGFRNPIAFYDGVPEVSVAVPVARNFQYFFPSRAAGTYMYHCHFEDVEHVQMGMDGVIIVRPNQDGNTALYPSGRYAYNDGDGTTGFDREFTLLLNELWTAAHDRLAAVQESNWNEYAPNYWLMNGRSYPHTLLRGTALGTEAFVLAIDDDDGMGPSLRQPVSSLVQVNEGERGLLRFVNLGFEQQSMHAPGIDLRIVGRDATYIGSAIDANAIYMGPGESRDVLFDAPAYTASGALIDDVGSYNRYFLKNRNVHRLTNAGLPGPGGQMTEIRVYPTGTLLAQTAPNQTYGGEVV